ncbi:MAG: class I SAM-dependent methyltransferase, partial [Planctomycetota bacterium]|nr:class I SAM-dependent methyltransferase [Planctomycetota bacterium]
ETAGFEPGSFDAVTALYVIEHVPDPRGLMRQIHRLLRPGGMILLRWPHTTPLVRILRPLGVDLRLYDLPSHLSDFSPRTMRLALEQEGFRSIRTGIGGWTLPRERWKRWPSRLGGVCAEGIALLTAGHLLLPGVSKTTVATRE